MAIATGNSKEARMFRHLMAMSLNIGTVTANAILQNAINMGGITETEWRNMTSKERADFINRNYESGHQGYRN